MDHPVSKRLGPAVAVVALLVLACGGNGATTAPASIAVTPTQGASTAPVTTPTPAPVATPSPEAACPADATQIEVQSWWTTGGEATGLQKLFDVFNAANPGLCAYNAAIAGGAGSRAQAIIKARVLGGAPPDSFQVHMGHELLDTYVNLPGGSLLDPLPTSVIDPSQFPAGVVKIISGTDGKVYTVPMNIHRANEMWFNKTVFSSNSLTAPTTWDDFFTTADALKAKGITALALGDNGIWAFGMVFEDVLIAKLGADGFSKLWTDPTAWSDPKVADALTTLQKVYGYVNADHNALSWDQANQLVIDGKAAMTLMGDWANGDYVAKNFTGYGWAPAPGSAQPQGTIYQALADSFPLPSLAPDKDATTKLLTFMATAQGQDIFNPYKGSIPANVTAGHPPANQQQYNDYQKSALADWTNSATVVIPSMEHGAAASPAFKSAIEAALTAFEGGTSIADTQTALVSAAQAALAP